MTDLRSSLKSSFTVERVSSASSQRKSDEKWGADVMREGFCVLPSILFRAQKRLGLTPTQLAILIQLADFWWEPSKKPRPGKQLLSDRMGLSPRQIQRHIAALETAGYVKRIERRSSNHAKLANTYDLSGLVKKLGKLAPEFATANKEAREKRQAVERRGGNKTAA